MNQDNNTPVKGDILIVDDDLPSLNTLSSMLTAEGYEVRGVPDGPMALTVIENKPPELILLDVKMPGMDGFEVCLQLKADKNSSGIPILFLSALDELEDKVKGFTSVIASQCSSPTKPVIPNSTSDIIQITGIVRYLQLEGGFYGIIGDDGEKYKPMNLEPQYEVDGLKVKVQARIVKGVAGIHMWGKSVEVLEIEKI